MVPGKSDSGRVTRNPKTVLAASPLFDLRTGRRHNSDTIIPLRDADEPLKSRRYFRG